MMPLVQDERGNVYEQLDRGMLRPMSREEVDALGKNPLESFGESVGLSTISAVKGAQKLLGNEQAGRDLEIARRLQAGQERVNPVASFAGQMVPGALVAAGTAGAGLPAVMGAEAALGAAYMPENPLLGAGVGAALPGAVAAVPMASRVIGNFARQAAEAMPGIPQMGIARQQNATGRVMQNIDAAAPDAPRGRVWEGLNTADEIEQMGGVLTPSMRASLNATSDAEMEAARRMKWYEDLRGVGPEETMKNRQVFTNMVKGELGISGPEALTDTVVGNALRTQGETIGAIVASRGPIEIGQEALTRIRQVVDDADSNFAGPLGNIQKDLEKMIKAGGGAVQPDDYQRLLTRLNEMMMPGGTPGKAFEAGKIADELHKAVEEGLAPELKRQLTDARYKYKIAKTLSETGARGNDWNVNPVSFGSRWDKRISQKARGQDVLGRAADTFSSIGRLEAHAGSTLQRNLAQLPGKVAENAPGAALGAAAGAVGLNWLTG